VVVRAEESLRRLGQFLSCFENCFGRSVQRGGVVNYVEGLCGPSEKKNLVQMLEKLNDPGDYQQLQHFVTSSPWDEKKVWSTLRQQTPERAGMLIQDDTGIPKQGTQSVGVKRQYSGTLGKIGNCQIAVSSILRAGSANWLLAMDLYLPKEWLEDEYRRMKAGIPDQVDIVRESNFVIECVAADAGYGVCAEYRAGLASRGLNYIVGVTGATTVYETDPRLVSEPKSRRGRPRKRPRLRKGAQTISLEKLAQKQGKWTKIKWRNGERKLLKGKFRACRIYSAAEWREVLPMIECWLLIEKRPNETKYYFSNLPADTPLQLLVEATHQRWAIEQSYREIKNELGFDHFAGRTYDGWNHHAVLVAVTHTFLQLERRRTKKKSEILPLPAVRKFVREIFLSLHVAGNRRLYRLVEHFHHNPPRRI
jgi:SRSO17 transposase